MLAAHLDERLVRALHDALRADVDPAARGHLAVHHQALAIELVEVLPRRPVRHQVGVREQHARRVGVRAEDADRLAGLHQQRLVVVEVAQRLEDGVVAFPVARGAADAAVHDQLGRVLGDFGIEVVLDHPVGGFGQPRLAAERGATRRADDAGGIDAGRRHGGFLRHGGGLPGTGIIAPWFCDSQRQCALIAESACFGRDCRSSEQICIHCIHARPADRRPHPARRPHSVRDATAPKA